jgi:WD40 repeat protein
VAHQGRALSLTGTADGQGLISGGRDGAVHIWHPDLEATRWELEPTSDDSDITTGPKNRLYVAGREISVWDLKTRKLMETFAPANPPWIHAACSADGRYLAAVGMGRISLFDLSTREVARTWTLENRLQPHRLAISSDGSAVAFAEYTDREFVTIYYREESRQPARFPAQQSNRLVFSSDGRWLATGHLDDTRLFDLKRPGEKCFLLGHSDTLSGISFTPDDQLLATVSHDRLLKLWRTDSGEEILSIVAHRDRIHSVAVTPDGRTIATAGDDKIVKLWHTATGQPLGALIPESHDFEKIEFGSDGRTLVALLNSGRVIVYDASSPD